MKDFTDKQNKAILLLAATFPESLDSIAAQIGCTRLTLSRWNQRPEFQQAVNDAKAKNSNNLVGEQQQRVVGFLPNVLSHLELAMQTDKPTPQSVRAAHLYLQIAGFLGNNPNRGGKPQQSQQPDVTPTMGVIETEFEEVVLDDVGNVVPLKSIPDNSNVS